MTVVLCLQVGKAAKLLDPFFIFQNEIENYPIRGVPDIVLGASYRTQRNGWMDGRVFADWLIEPRAVTKPQCSRIRTLCCDNAYVHHERPRALEELKNLNMILRKKNLGVEPNR